MKENAVIYILLTDTGSLFTRAIKQYTHAPYNHVSIALDRDMHQLYSYGRKHPLNPLNGGFVKEDVYYRYYRYYPKTTCALYELTVDARTVEKIRRIIHLFETKSRRFSYNFAGLLGVAINKPMKGNGTYFCSEFVAEVLNRAGVKLLDKPSALVTPEDFRASTQLQLIYEGKLIEEPKVRHYIHQLEQRQPK